MHEFGIIAEHEFEKEQIEDKYFFNLKLIIILDCDDRRYIELLIFLVEVNYRLNSKDKLTINFKLDVDSSAHN